LAQVGFCDSRNETVGSIRDGNFLTGSLSMVEDMFQTDG